MKFHSEPVEEHCEVPLADEGQWEALVDHWTEREKSPKTREVDGNRCYVVSVVHSQELYTDGKLREILGLVTAQKDRVVGYEVQYLNKVAPSTFLGKGKAMEIAQRARDEGADLLVVDAELSPSQMRNLEDQLGLPVCDREAVILNVFLKHAKTKAARIQVEIAHLEYLRPRIRGLGLSMDQQAGGVMGNRGPGETASELLARKLDRRLTELRKKQAKQKRQSAHQRKHRVSTRRIALVGYTNAGKTSLMNALTAAEGSARNMPFETLDTTTRSLTRHGGDVLLSDTVGFIRNLPKRLFASFASTLAEIVEASLVVLVMDVSDPDWRLHVETTEQMLKELDADEIPRLYVFNKVDQLQETIPQEWLGDVTGQHDFVTLSAHNPDDILALKETMLSHVRGEVPFQILVPYEDTLTMSKVYAHCRVLEAESSEAGMLFSLEAESKILSQLQQSMRREEQ